MAALDDSKVMDVSKPGKGKIVSTSRPVVAPIKATEKKEEAPTLVPVKEEGDSEGETVAVQPPSVGHKVIQPLNDLNDEKTEDVQVSEETPESKEETIDSGPSDSGSESAEVNALAESVESKKQAAKKAEEQAKKDAELQELINSRKYVVPVGRGGKSGGSGKIAAIVLSLLLLAAVAGYVLIDFGVIKTDIKLPFEFSKEESSSDKSDNEAVNIPSERDTQAEDDKTEETDTEEAGEQPAAQVRGRDTDRKNELKNLQMKLETYFNDNGVYPMTLADLSPALTTDEIQGPSDDPYTYTSDGASYTLAADLENDNDPDADDSGNYVITSINQ